MVSAGLHALFCVPYGLQDNAGIIQVVSIQVFLFADLTEQYANLVRDVGDGIVAGLLTPLRKLACNGNTFLTSGFVGSDQAVFGFDQLVEFFRELRLGGTSQRTEAESMMTRAGARVAFLFAGTD